MVTLTEAKRSPFRHDIMNEARKPRNLKQVALELYPNIKSIFLLIYQDHFHSICLKLARRHRRKFATPRKIHTYAAVLERFDLQQRRNSGGLYAGQEIRKLTQELCARIFNRERSGMM